MNEGTPVEGGRNMWMRASWQTMSARSEVLSASAKLGRQVAKLSRQIASDVRHRVSEGVAPSSSAAAVWAMSAPERGVPPPV
jgi:hypothetical protein